MLRTRNMLKTFCHFFYLPSSWFCHSKVKWMISGCQTVAWLWQKHIQLCEEVERLPEHHIYPSTRLWQKWTALLDWYKCKVCKCALLCKGSIYLFLIAKSMFEFKNSWNTKPDERENEYTHTNTEWSGHPVVAQDPVIRGLSFFGLSVSQHFQTC